MVLVLAAACTVPSGAPSTTAPAARATGTPAGHDGRCTGIGVAPEEVVARFFTFVGQQDARGISDCFARAYLAAQPDAPLRWAGAGPVRRFSLASVRSPDDTSRVRVTAELLTGIGDWKGTATHDVVLRRDPDRWAIAAIE